MNAEQQRLCDAVDWFAGEMKAKLCTKEEGGWVGWRLRHYIEGPNYSRIESHVARLGAGEPQEVDIANLCMFQAHFRHTHEPQPAHKEPTA